MKRCEIPPLSKREDTFKQCRQTTSLSFACYTEWLYICQYQTKKFTALLSHSSLSQWLNLTSQEAQCSCSHVAPGVWPAYVLPDCILATASACQAAPAHADTVFAFLIFMSALFSLCLWCEKLPLKTSDKSHWGVWKLNIDFDMRHFVKISFTL